MYGVRFTVSDASPEMFRSRSHSKGERLVPGKGVHMQLKSLLPLFYMPFLAQRPGTIT